MLIRKMAREDVEAALEVTRDLYRGNFRVTLFEPGGPRAVNWRVIIRPLDLSGPGVRRGRPGGINRGAGTKRIRSCCWHVHRDLYLSLFERNPGASIETWVTAYRGLEHFLETYPATGEMVRYRSMGRGPGGSLYFEDHTMQELCNCDEFPEIYEEGPAAELWRRDSYRISGVMPGPGSGPGRGREEVRHYA